MSRPIGRTIVTYGLAAIGGLIGAILLWLSTGFVADFLLGLSGMSAREGGRAMVAFFAIGPFGALLGFGLGVWLVLHQRVIGFYALTDDVLVRNGPPPQLLFELRLPAGTVLPDQLEGVSVSVSVDFDTDKNQMFSTLTGTTADNDRPVIQGVVDLYFRTSSRILVLHIRTRSAVRAQAPVQPSCLGRFRAMAARRLYRRQARRRIAQSGRRRQLRGEIPAGRMIANIAR
jgi:hypothetical protein